MPKEPSTANSASSCGGGTGKGRRVKKRLTFYSHKSSRDHLRSPFKKVHIRGNQKYRCSVKKQKFGDRRKVSVLIKTKIRMSGENSLIICFEKFGIAIFLKDTFKTDIFLFSSIKLQGYLILNYKLF